MPVTGMGEMEGRSHKRGGRKGFTKQDYDKICANSSWKTLYASKVVWGR